MYVAFHIVHFVFTQARSSSGLGRRPLKAEITGSNPVRATNSFLLFPDKFIILQKSLLIFISLDQNEAI